MKTILDQINQHAEEGFLVALSYDQVQVLNRQFGALTDQLKDTKAYAETLVEANHNAQLTNYELRIQLETAIDDLEQELRNVDAQLSVANAEIEDLEESLVNAEEEIDALMEDLLECEDELAEMTTLYIKEVLFVSKYL